MSVSLDSITGNNLEEIINTTNKNFQKLSEVEFLRGDAGATLSIVNRDIDDELAKEIATCIVGDTEKVVYIDNIKEQLKTYNKKWLWFYSSDTPICPAVPLVFLDNDVVNNPENKPDYTCSVVGSIDEDDKVVYSRTAIQPELYFDETALEGTGAWCWEINGVKTGIPASAANVEDRTIPQFFLLKQEKEGSENITYFTVKDENSYGFIPWSEYYTKTGVSKPSSEDYAFIIRTNKNEDGSTVNSLGMSVCSSAGAGENIPPTWVPSVFDESYLVSFDKALMKFIFGELYVMEGVTDTVHEGNKKHGLRLKFKDGGDASVYIDTVKGTGDNDNSSLYFIFDPYETADGNSPVSNNLNIVIDSTSGDSNLNFYKGSIEDKNRYITAGEILVSGSYSTIYNLYKAGKLIPGCFYEIEDYTLVLDPDRTDIKSGDHKFNIILQAISKNKFSEVAKAAPSKDESDTYFNNCDLSKWELKYCIENDIDRFDWAYNRGQGVIYYMKDEWNNECPYDFKNVMYKWDAKTTGQRQLREENYGYTFCYRHNDIYDYTVNFCKEGIVKNNKITPYYNTSKQQILNNIIIGVFCRESDDESYIMYDTDVACISHSITKIDNPLTDPNNSFSFIKFEPSYNPTSTSIISIHSNILDNIQNIRVSSLMFNDNRIINSKSIYTTGFDVCSNIIENSNYICMNYKYIKYSSVADQPVQQYLREVFRICCIVDDTKYENDAINTVCSFNNIINSEHISLVNSSNNIIKDRKRILGSAGFPITSDVELESYLRRIHDYVSLDNMNNVSLICSNRNIIDGYYKKQYSYLGASDKYIQCVELVYSDDNYIGKNSTNIYISYAKENKIGNYCTDIVLDNTSATVAISNNRVTFLTDTYIESNNIGDNIMCLNLKKFLTDPALGFPLTNIKRSTINRLDKGNLNFYNKAYNLKDYNTASSTQRTNSDTIFILDSTLSTDGNGIYRYTTGTNLATKLLS